MDWKRAISRNREALQEVAAALFVLARMRIGGSLLTLPRATLSAILLVLRPAESALRRLIVIAAQGLAPSTSPRSAWSAAEIARLANLHPCGGDVTAGDRGGSLRAFQLFDPLKSYDPEAHLDTVGLVYVTAEGARAFASALDNTPVNAAHIGLRLNALMRALNTIPRQARRLMRWQAKRDALLLSRRPTRLSPIRPGLPPGWRQRRIHEIDTVLVECHRLVRDLPYVPPNTS